VFIHVQIVFFFCCFFFTIPQGQETHKIRSPKTRSKPPEARAFTLPSSSCSSLRRPFQTPPRYAATTPGSSQCASSPSPSTSPRSPLPSPSSSAPSLQTHLPKPDTISVTGSLSLFNFSKFCLACARLGDDHCV
jgi:hypothetical protein